MVSGDLAMAKVKVTKDNIFEDLGFAKDEALGLKLRADCIAEVVRISHENDYSQKELTKILDLSQSRVSDLLNAKISKFNLETLVDYLELLGAEPEIKTKIKHPKKITAQVTLVSVRR